MIVVVVVVANNGTAAVLRDDDVDGRRHGHRQRAVRRPPGRVDGAVVFAARIGAADVRRRVVVAQRARIVRPVDHFVDVRRRLAAVSLLLLLLLLLLMVLFLMMMLLLLLAVDRYAGAIVSISCASWC